MKMFIFLIFLQLNCFAAEYDKKVTVSGQCITETTPDRGSLTFVAEDLDRDAKNAISKATALYEKMKEEFKRSKVKSLELSSTEYTVNEQMAWENNKSVSKGFRARLGLKAVTPDIANMGELISIAARIGVRDTHSLTTFLSDAKMLEEKKKCLDIAAKHAREKALTLTQSLGAKLGRVLQITESGVTPPPPPYPMMERAMMKSATADAGAPGIEGQKQTISQNVDVTFAIE